MSTHSESASTHRASNSGGPARSRGNSVADCSKGTSIFTGRSNKEFGDFSGSTSVNKLTPKPTNMSTTTPKTNSVPTTPRPSSPIEIPAKKMNPLAIPFEPINSKLPIPFPDKDKFVDVSLEDVPQEDGSGEGLKDWISVPKLEDEWVSVSKTELGLKDRDEKDKKRGVVDSDVDEKPSRDKKLTASGPWNVITYAGGTWNDPKWPRPAGQH